MKNLNFVLLFFLFSLKWSSAQNTVYVAENLGKNINSSCYDYRPKLTADGKNLYFTRLICMDEEQMSDEGLLFHSYLKEDSSWSKAEPVIADFNKSKFSPYLYSVSPDNNQLLLTLKSPEDNSRFLCKVYRNASGWSKPDTLDIGIALSEINSTFTLSDNGRILIYSYEPSDAKTEFYGGKDLYVSFLQNDGHWTKPLNLGARINTPYIDLNPFLASDNKTLYFSSKHSISYGQNDIYVSKRLDKSWRNWSEPLNLGKEINDENWNDGFFIPVIGNYAYFNSERSGYGQGDIFRIKMRSQIKPDKVVLVQGIAINKEGQPIGGATIYYENLSGGKLVGTARSHPETGRFQISLPLGINYGIYAESKGMYAITSYLNLMTDSTAVIIKDTIKLIPLLKGENIRLNNIFFSVNSAVLAPESFSELDRLVAILEKNKNLKIRVDGHTDDLGDEKNNLILSEKRAKAVYFYLLSKGINKEQIEVKAFGETQPVVANTTEKGRKRNRRVEITVLENK